MQTTGSLVGAFLEFAAELEDRHHTFESADITVELFGELLVTFHGNAAAIVLNGHTAVGVNRNRDRFGEARHCFVNRVVDHFVNEVMQPPLRGIPDVHAGSFPNMLQVRKVLQILRFVVGIGGRDRGSGGFASLLDRGGDG